MYAAIRQGKAKAGKAEELTRRIKEGAIPDHQRGRRLHGLLRGLCARRHGDRDQPVQQFCGAEESNKRALAWIEQELAPLLTGPATAMAGPVIVHTLA